MRSSRARAPLTSKAWLIELGRQAPRLAEAFALHALAAPTMTAAEIMTRNPQTMFASQTVSEAVEAFQSLRVHYLPIVDDRGHLVGMLSERNLGPWMRIFSEGEEANDDAAPPSERRVAELISDEIVAVEADADVSEVVEEMLLRRTGIVPVVDDADNVIGVISKADLLRTISAR